jgi:hypothetical protein
VTRPRAHEHGGGALGQTRHVTTPPTNALVKRRRAPSLEGQDELRTANNRFISYRLGTYSRFTDYGGVHGRRWQNLQFVGRW